MTVIDVFVAENLVDGVAVGDLLFDHGAIDDLGNDLDAIFHDMVLVARVFLESALQALTEEVGGVGGDLASKQVETEGEPVVDRPLDHLEGDPACADRVSVSLLGQLCTALDDSIEARFSHEQVMGLLGEHEFAGPCERLEATFSQRGELELAIAVGEVGEAEE